jgi:hypothetical protein
MGGTLVRADQPLGCLQAINSPGAMQAANAIAEVFQSRLQRQRWIRSQQQGLGPGIAEALGITAAALG